LVALIIIIIGIYIVKKNNKEENPNAFRKY
jgi:glucose uptake protein GlcU